MLKKLIILVGLILSLFVYSSGEAAVIEEESQPLKGSAVVVTLKSDKIRYLAEKDLFIATGKVKIEVEAHGTVIESDEVTFDKTNQVIVSEKNVKITKPDGVIYGDYARFDLAIDQGFLGHPIVELKQINLIAEEAEIISEDIEMLKGKATLSQKDMVLVLTTGSLSRDGDNRMFQNRPDVDPKFNYDVKAQEMIIEEYEYNNVVTLKNATISLNRFKLAKVPVMQMSIEKETSRIETMLPEFGHRKELGAYFGHGHVFHVYKGSTLKALPIFTWGDNGIGGGGMARYMSSSNHTEILYSSLKNKVVLEGEQNIIGKQTQLLYGINSYMDNGFFGNQKPNFLIEVVDKRKLAEAYNFQFNLRSSAGFVEDEEGDFSTAKFQLQGSLFNQEPLFGYNKYLNVGIASDFSINAYGTSDTYGVVRAGPTLESNLGPLNLWAAYYQGAIYGETPFLYDRYLYGRSNLVFLANLKIHKYVTLSYLTSLNLNKDNWNNTLVTENQIYFWVGPEELKFKLGYDVERARTVFGFDMLVGSENSEFEFDKLKVKQKK